MQNKFAAENKINNCQQNQVNDLLKVVRNYEKKLYNESKLCLEFF